MNPTPRPKHGPVATPAARYVMDKGYRTVVADPPWNVQTGPAKFTTLKEGKRPNPKRIDGRSRDLPFAAMTVEEIAALPVGEWCENDAHLYLWTINSYVPVAYEVSRAWGFKPSALLTWCKAPMGHGLGGTYRNTTEFCLFARRGTLRALQEVSTSWFQWKRPYVNGDPVHSMKPDAFLDMVEQVSPGPYLEMFARRARFGWDYWGDESLGTAKVA